MSTRRATENQIATLKRMLDELAEIGEKGADLAGRSRMEMNQLYTRGEFTFAVASSWFGKVKDLKREAQAAQRRPAQFGRPYRPAKPEQAEEAAPAPRRRKVELPEVPEGHYALPGKDEGNEGAIRYFRIERSANGFVTGYVQASDDLHPLRFRALAAVMDEIVAYGPMESAVLYGKTLGVCGRCGRTLTDEESRERGIGPICASKY